eukprot:1194016-Prorocentrum_minimum.AAC.1
MYSKPLDHLPWPIETDLVSLPGTSTWFPLKLFEVEVETLYSSWVYPDDLSVAPASDVSIKEKHRTARVFAYELDRPFRSVTVPRGECRPVANSTREAGLWLLSFDGTWTLAFALRFYHHY